MGFDRAIFETFQDLVNPTVDRLPGITQLLYVANNRIRVEISV